MRTEDDRLTYDYGDNPYLNDPRMTADTCQSCYEADDNVPHAPWCGEKDMT